MAIKIGFNEDLHQAPELAEAGTEAFGFWVRLVCWSVRSSVEGFVPTEVVEMFQGVESVHLLVEAEFLVEAPGGYQLINGTLRSNGKPYWIVKLPQSKARIPLEVRLRIYARDGYRCRHCGSTENLSLDHIWPRARGGTDAEDNLQVLCIPCNSSKGART